MAVVVMYVMLQGFSCMGKLPETAVPAVDAKVMVPDDVWSKVFFLHNDGRKKNSCYKGIQKIRE